MNYRQWGKLGEKVSVIGFGGAALSSTGGGYGFGEVDRKEVHRLLSCALDRGINTFDTAPIYGYGHSEKTLGHFFSTAKRERVLLVSKSGVTWHKNKRVNLSNDAKTTKVMLEQSLRDLQSDYIDLYMIHWPDPRVDIRVPMEVLTKAQEKGQIRYLGLANTTEKEVRLAEEISPISVIQNELNGFDQTGLERVKGLLEEGRGFMGWGTLDKGILTGRLTQKRLYQDDYDCRKKAPWWDKSVVKEKINLVDGLKNWSLDVGHDLLSFAVASSLESSLVSQVLCGAKNVHQMETLCDVLENMPGQNLLEEYRRRLHE